ncbi:ABC transporter permease [Geminicoccaceae bacterium 1502E]|nr:ABC transporter permease [Geminicoccaceae bacterium 1502E]
MATAREAAAGREAGSGARRLSFFMAVLRTHPSFALGYAIVGAVVLLAVFAPWIAPYPPEQADAMAFLQPPGWPHLMGTDATGMDIFSRIIWAPRIDLSIAILGTLLSALVGTTLGALVGYYQSVRGLGRIGAGFIMRSADVLQAFPVFVFAIALVAVFGQSLQSIVLAIAFVNAPIYLRLMRTQVMSIRTMRYVEAAWLAGMSDVRIIARHIVPNAMAPVLAQLSVNIGWSVLLTAALSFIGAGVKAPTPEWGSMIAMGYQNIVTGHWWPSIFPGLALALTVFGFSLVGSSIEILSDPARRRRLAGRLEAARGIRP